MWLKEEKNSPHSVTRAPFHYFKIVFEQRKQHMGLGHNYPQSNLIDRFTN